MSQLFECRMACPGVLSVVHGSEEVAKVGLDGVTISAQYTENAMSESSLAHEFRSPLDLFAYIYYILYIYNI